MLTPGISSRTSVLRNVIITSFIFIFYILTNQALHLCLSSCKPAIKVWPGFSFISIMDTGSSYFPFRLFFI